MASIAGFCSPHQASSSLGGSCSDQEVISILRKYRSCGLEPEVRRSINRVLAENVCHGVWQLYVNRDYKAMEGWTIHYGPRSRKKLVSIPNTSQGNSPNSPKFLGTKTTEEFKPTDGTKAVIGMTQYNLLMTMKDRRGLYLDELSLCHTYPLQRKETVIRNRNGKRPHAADHCDAVLPPLDELDQDTSKVDVTEFSPLDVDDYGVDVPDLLSTDSSKRPRPESKHWHNFTKIYTKNPEVMYAACNH